MPTTPWCQCSLESTRALRSSLGSRPIFSTASAQTLAQEVLAGKYGNGDTRKTVLGSRYNEVQAIVNQGGKKSIDEVAREVIRGEWGNGTARKQKLEAAGYDYETVQARVNALL